MENMYKLEISKEEFLKILSDYFENRFKKKVNVKVKTIEDYDIYEEIIERFQFYFDETISLLGHPATRTTVLTDDEIKIIFDELVSNDGYSVQHIFYNFENERDNYNAVNKDFKGVTINLKNNQIQLTRKY